MLQVEGLSLKRDRLWASIHPLTVDRVTASRA